MLFSERFDQWVDPDFEAFNSIDSLKNYMHLAKNNTESYLSKLSEEELNRQIFIPCGGKPDARINI